MEWISSTMFTRKKASWISISPMDHFFYHKQGTLTYYWDKRLPLNLLHKQNTCYALTLWKKNPDQQWWEIYFSITLFHSPLHEFINVDVTHKTLKLILLLIHPIFLDNSQNFIYLIASLRFQLATSLLIADDSQL